MLGVPAVYISIGAIALVFALRVLTRRPVGYVLACAASGGICLALAVMQGHPRPYTLIPLFLAAVACSLEAVFSPAVKSLNREQRLVIVRGRPIMRYFSSQLEYARIGPTPEDEYMSWVRKNVAANEDIDVIALQYGGTSAFDPVLSTIRLGRRVNSANPILQFPLRAALVSGDRGRIDAAWTRLSKKLPRARRPGLSSGGPRQLPWPAISSEQSRRSPGSIHG